MLAQSVQVETRLQNLSQDLKDFGLNPQHWQVFQLSSTKAGALHKSESLFLVGALSDRGGRTSWSELEIHDRDDLEAAQR